MKYRVFAAVLALSSVLLAPLASAADQRETMSVDNTSRSFLMHIPDQAPPAGGFPLILAFHGGGMQAAGMRQLTHLDREADARAFIVVYPNGVDRHWNDGRSSIKNPQADVRFISDLIDKLQHDHPIDARRIYATGLSNGALFVERLGCDLSDKIAAIAPVAGSLPAELASSCTARRGVAVLQIDGTDDPIMPFNGGAVSTLGGAGEGGDVLSVSATAALWARVDGCSLQTSVRAFPPAVAFDRTRISETSYQGCPTSRPVKIISVIGGGHAWPGGPQYARPRVVGLASRQFDASQRIADFFLSLSPASQH